MRGRITVWDAPVRLFHWALVGLVAFSFFTANVGGSWMDWHLRSGYAILALLLFRFAWGVVGSDTARFGRFLRGPGAALEYARATLARRHPAHAGHNPLGGWMVLLMLVVLLVQASTGLFADDEIATQGPLAAKVSNALVSRMSAIHSFNQGVIIALVALHVAAVAAYRWVLGVRLVGPMVHGRVPAEAGIATPRLAPAWLAAIFLAAAAAFVYWLVAVYPKSGA